MLMKIFMAAGLVVGAVAIHAAGFDALLRTIVRSRALDVSRFWRVTPLVIGLTCC
jgi:hypothetical protein